MRRRVLVPLAVLLGLVGLLAVALAWLLGTESGLRWTYERARARLPGELAVEALSGRIAGPLELRGLRYRDGDTSVELDAASLDWSPTALLAARLRVSALALDGLRVTLPPPVEKPAPRQAPTLPRLPLTLSVGEARLRGLAIARAGASPVEIRVIEIEDGGWGPRTLALARLNVETERFSVTARGGVALDGGEQALEVAWRVTPPGFASVAGRGTVSGTLERIVVAQELTEPIRGTLRAELRDALAKLAWNAELSLPAIDPRQIKPGWPSLAAGLDVAAQGDATRFAARGRARLAHAGQELLGRFTAKGDREAVVLEALDLTVEGTPAAARVQGRWGLEGPRFDVQASWRALQWPLARAPVVASPEGEARIAGDLNDYRIEGALRTEGPNLPAARWRLAGRGDTKEIRVESVRAELLGGRMDGEARVTWAPQLAWSASARATGINPATVWPDWPGELGAAARAQGSAQALELDLERLQGTLRGRPVRARGRLVRQGAHYPDLRLEARSAGATARVSGRVTTAWDMRWEIKARDLAAVWPEAAGQLEGKGRIHGPRAGPRVEADLAGQRLSYEDVRLQALALTGTIDLSDKEPSRASIDARGLISQGRELARATVRAEGRIAEHTVSAHAATEDLAATLRLAGSYDAGAWQGELRQAIVNSEAAGFWTLQTPAPLRVARDRVVLGKACLRARRPDACIAIDWDPNAASHVLVSANTVPLALLAPLLPQTVRIKGTVSGDADVRLDRRRLTRAQAELALSPGTLTLAAKGAGASAVSFRGGTARLRVDDQGLRSHAEVRLAGEDGARLDLALPKFDGSAPAGPTQPLAGRLVARIADVAPLLPLFPEIERLRGSVQADFTLGGTLAEPQFRGAASLRDASARLSGPGIQLESVELTATAERNDVLTVRGQARSGKGRIEINGTLGIATARTWQAKLEITGDRFQAVDLREASVVVSPNLRLDVVPRNVKIDGEIRIPQARFAPRPRLGGRTSAVPVSRDVVIVNAPEDETEAVPTTPWTVSGKVQVILGERVSFDGFGLTGNIAGQITVVETPGRVTSGRGEVRIVDGKYEAFGQKLEIERGRLLFAGGPIDNPGIDARAVRKIEDVTAGVTVKGTLREPDFALFSEPAMSQADALSHLLFGHPLESADAAQGKALAGAAAALRLTGGEFLAQRIGARFGIEEVSIEGGAENQDAALVLGRQLSPRLYVNYSIGLFEQVNLFRIRYKLSARWALQAESGPYSGGDLLYTIER